MQIYTRAIHCQPKSKLAIKAFLASPDALEVIVVPDSLTPLLSVSTDLTDVSLAS